MNPITVKIPIIFSAAAAISAMQSSIIFCHWTVHFDYGAGGL
jgi:hypothetical protein